MFRINARVDGISARESEKCASCDQHSSGGRERGDDGGDGERCPSHQEQLAAADTIPERSHGNERSSDHESVDIDDPQQLRAARLELNRQRGNREVQNREIHRQQDARKCEDGEADPFAAARERILDVLIVGHRVKLKREKPDDERRSTI